MSDKDLTPSEADPKPISVISHGPSSFDQFLEKYQKMLIGLAILLVLGMVAYLVLDGMKKINDQAVGSTLTNAESVDDFSAVASNNSGNVADTATLLKAKKQAKEDVEAAIATLNALISTNPSSVVINEAKLNLAMYQLEAGKEEEAKQTLTALSQDNTSKSYTGAVAKLALSDVELNQGDLAKSKEFANTAHEELEFAGLKQLAGDARAVVAVQAPELKITEIPVVTPAAE
ncbi:tetratricopeptide repeat protein [Akkermansiaceae bacterium]|nr:tetratricopeptide repeat protein [Akkermansiaceae bacterium]